MSEFSKINRRLFIVLFGLLMAVGQVGFMPQSEVHAAGSGEGHGSLHDG